MREKYCFTIDLSRFALYFSCSGRVLGTGSILGHVWYALRTHRVYCSSATKGVRWAAPAIIPKPSFFLCLRLPILFELTVWAPSDATPLLKLVSLGGMLIQRPAHRQSLFSKTKTPKRRFPKLPVLFVPRVILWRIFRKRILR